MKISSDSSLSHHSSKALLWIDPGENKRFHCADLRCWRWWFGYGSWLLGFVLNEIDNSLYMIEYSLVYRKQYTKRNWNFILAGLVGIDFCEKCTMLLLRATLHFLEFDHSNRQNIVWTNHSCMWYVGLSWNLKMRHVIKIEKIEAEDHVVTARHSCKVSPIVPSFVDNSSFCSDFLAT